MVLDYIRITQALDLVGPIIHRLDKIYTGHDYSLFVFSHIHIVWNESDSTELSTKWLRLISKSATAIVVAKEYSSSKRKTLMKHYEKLLNVCILFWGLRKNIPKYNIFKFNQYISTEKYHQN